MLTNDIVSFEQLSPNICQGQTMTVSLKEAKYANTDYLEMGWATGVESNVGCCMNR